MPSLQRLDRLVLSLGSILCHLRRTFILALWLCNTDDNSIFVVLMVTTTQNGVDNYKMTDNDQGTDKTNDPVYHFIKFELSGQRLWENIWSTTNQASYPGGIASTIFNTTTIVHNNVFDQRNSSTQSDVKVAAVGAPDLKISRSFDHSARTTSVSDWSHPKDLTRSGITHTLFGNVLSGDEAFLLMVLMVHVLVADHNPPLTLQLMWLTSISIFLWLLILPLLHFLYLVAPYK